MCNDVQACTSLYLIVHIIFGSTGTIHVCMLTQKPRHRSSVNSITPVTAWGGKIMITWTNLTFAPKEKREIWDISVQTFSRLKLSSVRKCSEIVASCRNRRAQEMQRFFKQLHRSWNRCQLTHAIPLYLFLGIRDSTAEFGHHLILPSDFQHVPQPRN